MAGRTAGRARRARRPLPLEVGIGVLVAAWTAVLATRPIGDNSFFTHLATGHLILDGGVPRSDPYSYTAAGEPWVVQSWLASVVYAVVDDLAGVGGLQVLTGVLAGIVAWLAWRLTRPGVTLVSRIAVVALFLATVNQFLSPRPMLMGLVAFAVVVVAEEAGWTRPWPLALLGAVWVNVHGSWPLGLVLLAASLAGRWADARWGGGGDRGGDLPDARPVGPAGLDRGGMVRLGSLAAGVVVGGLASLAGPRVLVFPVELLGRSEGLSVITEWQSPSFDRSWARCFLVLAVVGVLGLARRPSYRGWVVWSVFVAAALLGLRNIPVAAIAVLPLAALGAGGIGHLDARRRSPVAGMLVAAALVLAVVGTAGRTRDAELALDGFPVEALEVAERAGWVTDPDVRLVTHEDVGNLIELRHGTDAAVFLDDRVDMYPADVLDDYMVLVRGRPGWAEVLDRWDVDVVLWRDGLPLATILAEADGWEVVHDDDRATIFCRSSSGRCDLR